MVKRRLEAEAEAEAEFKLSIAKRSASEVSLFCASSFRKHSSASWLADAADSFDISATRTRAAHQAAPVAASLTPRRPPAQIEAPEPAMPPHGDAPARSALNPHKVRACADSSRSARGFVSSTADRAGIAAAATGRPMCAGARRRATDGSDGERRTVATDGSQEPRFAYSTRQGSDKLTHCVYRTTGRR